MLLSATSLRLLEQITTDSAHLLTLHLTPPDLTAATLYTSVLTVTICVQVSVKPNLLYLPSFQIVSGRVLSVNCYVLSSDIANFVRLKLDRINPFHYL